MASTGKTTNYELSQFIGTDKPSWLGDYNGDMLKIDTALGSINATATTAQSGVASAQSAASAAQQTANAAQQSASTNARDITEIKGNLAASSLSFTSAGNPTYNYLYTFCSKHLTINISHQGWSTLPNNSVVRSDQTLVPLGSINNKNVYGIGASSITDTSNKIFLGFLTGRFERSSGTLIDTAPLYAWYDGTNTNFYLQFKTSQYSAYTEITEVWGQTIYTNTGVFVEAIN